MNLIHYIPIATTLFGLFFFFILYSHWTKNRKSLHVFWWMLGVLCYISGTVSESVNTLAGFSIANFRIWYITGALLGGAPLAQGTVYLLCKRKLANFLTIVLTSVIIISAVLVILSPIHTELITGRLSGKLLGWKFIRYMTPFINLYAFVFLVGGAIYSAVKYAKNKQFKKRFTGNLFIAIGGLLPGIGGSFTKFGFVEVLYVTEFVGLLFIYLGYKTIKSDHSVSLHETQQYRLSLQ
ncbi:MAG: hypothetical protein JJE22_16930 [Bacteroidia bacterium]|nr:hypothetical protein [Bacteroidia bacterium]